MRQINHGVTVLRVRRKEWLKAAENRCVLCNHAIPFDSVAIVFVDSAKLTGLTVLELKERFPFEAKLPNHGVCEMYVYEIEPICESELRNLLYSPEE